MIANININYKVLAKHFQGSRSEKSANEAFRLLWKKWENEKRGLWVLYVKAYNFDKLIKKEN